MERLSAADQELVAIDLTEEIEVDTLCFAIGLFLDSHRRSLVVPEDRLGTLAGYTLAEDTAQELAEGKRILSSEADLYLAHISLTHFTAVFDTSIRFKRHEKTAQEYGLTPDEFTNYAITGHQLLQLIPPPAE